MTDAKLTLSIDGQEYELVPPFTNRELHVIKQITGVRAGEMWQAMEAGDSDMIVALAHLAVRRAGKQRPTLDDLWDMPAGAVSVVMPDAPVEVDEDPPADAGDVLESAAPAGS